MRLRNRYRLPLTALAMLAIVGAILYPLNLLFVESKPLRPIDYYDSYSGTITHCNTVNHYADQPDKLDKLINYANNNAMGYLYFRFGKDKGKILASTCEVANPDYILEQCQHHPEQNVESLHLQFNRVAVRETGLL